MNTVNKFLWIFVAVSVSVSTAAQTNDAQKEARANVIKRYRPLRVINDELFDFTQVETDLETFRKKGGDFFLTTYKKYIIDGNVQQVVKDGMLVMMAERLLFLTNYPGQKSAVDGVNVFAVAVYLFPYHYTSTIGAQRTVPMWDCGRTYDPETDKFTVKTFITRSGEITVPVTDADRVPIKPSATSR